MSVTVSPTNSKVSFATKPIVRANNVDIVAIKVRVKDQNNAPIPSRRVELITAAPGVTITQPQPTDETGLAIGYVKSNVVGPATFSARVLPDVNPAVPENSPGQVLIANTVTANFYAQEIDPAPELPPSARNIHITWSVSRYYLNNIDGIRVRIEADDATLMPTKIFAYQMAPVKPGETEPVGAFDHVCSAVDLEEYPEDEPVINSRPQWFRLN